MKAAFIMYNQSMNQFILQILKQADVDGYTLWQNVLGEGESEPKEGSHVWPSLNNVVMTITEEKKIKAISSDLKKLRDKHPLEGMRMFVLPCDEVD